MSKAVECSSHWGPGAEGRMGSGWGSMLHAYIFSLVCVTVCEYCVLFGLLACCLYLLYTCAACSSCATPCPSLALALAHAVYRVR